MTITGPIRTTALAALLLAGAPVMGAAQEPAAPADCTCLADLDTLAAKLQRNYVAWHIEYAGTRREAEFRRFLARLRDRAERIGDADCIFVLRELTNWFRDGHLFVFQNPRLTPEQADRMAEAAEVRTIDEAALRADLVRHAGRLDPVAGIWYAPGYRIGIVADTGGGRGAFVGIVLASDSARWKPGHVKVRLRRNRDGTYRTILYAADHSRRDTEGRLYRNTLLTTQPMTWGRELPLAAHEAGTLDPVDPLRPTLRLAGRDAVIVSVPSHDPKYRAVLDSLVTRHRADLLSRPFLLIDIRGDLGGGSMTTAPLVPLLATREQRPPIGPSGPSTVVASADNIRYFGRGWNPDSIAERMAAAPGRVMPLMRNETLDMPFDADTVHAMPARVAVLMDRGVASAGEAFLLQARKSTKVTLYGDNSWGMIDYQSVNVVRLDCRPRGILFGYPMIAASNTLPADGLNAKGIPPDVRVPRSIPDPVAWTLRQLAR